MNYSSYANLFIVTASSRLVSSHAVIFREGSEISLTTPLKSTADFQQTRLPPIFYVFQKDELVIHCMSGNKSV